MIIKDIELKPAESGIIRWIIRNQLNAYSRIINQDSSIDVVMYAIENSLPLDELTRYMYSKKLQFEKLLEEPVQVFNLTGRDYSEVVTILVNGNFRHDAFKKAKARIYEKFCKVTDFKRYYNAN